MNRRTWFKTIAGVSAGAVLATQHVVAEPTCVEMLSDGNVHRIDYWVGHRTVETVVCGGIIVPHRYDFLGWSQRGNILRVWLPQGCWLGDEVPPVTIL